MRTSKLGMIVFLASDSLTFAALLFALGMLRLRQQNWPVAGAYLDVPLAAGMTAALAASSITMTLATRAARAGRTRRAAQFLALTMLGGLLFLAGQAMEWTELAREGVGLGPSLALRDGVAPAFSSTFYVITGFHGAHVATGLVLLGATLVGSLRTPGAEARIETTALFWNFVDGVWVVVFTCIYLV